MDDRVDMDYHQGQHSAAQAVGLGESFAKSNLKLTAIAATKVMTKQNLTDALQINCEVVVRFICLLYSKTLVLRRRSALAGRENGPVAGPANWERLLAKADTE